MTGDKSFNPDAPDNNEGDFEREVRMLIESERNNLRTTTRTSIISNLMPVHRHLMNEKRNADTEEERRTAEYMLSRMNQFLSEIRDQEGEIDRLLLAHRTPPKPRRRRA